MLARIAESLRCYPLIAFFALAYAITWSGWWPEMAGSQFGAFLGYSGPAIAAILVTSPTSGRQGLGELLARQFQWRVPLRWWLVAVLLPIGSVLVALALPVLAGHATNHAQPGLLAPLLPDLGLVLALGSLYGVVIAAGEELGWRESALPRLLRRHNALVGSAFIGIFWGPWHLPVSYFFGGGSPSRVNSLLYGLGNRFCLSALDVDLPAHLGQRVDRLLFTRHMTSRSSLPARSRLWRPAWIFPFASTSSCWRQPLLLSSSPPGLT